MAYGIAGYGELPYATLPAAAAAGVTATGAVTLGAFTASATATTPITAAGAVTLDAFTGAATAAIPVTSAGAATLDPFTAAGTATVLSGPSLVGAATLDAFTAAGAATIPVTAAGAATLDAFTGAATATVPVTAAGTTTLGAFTASATATVADAGGITVIRLADNLDATIRFYTPGTDANPFPAASDLWTYYDNGAADGNRVACIVKLYNTGATAGRVISVSKITFYEFGTTQPYGAIHAASTDVDPACTKVIANDASWGFYEFDLGVADSWPTTANGDGWYGPEILAEGDAAELQITADGDPTDPYLTFAFTLEFSKGGYSSLKARILAEGGEITLNAAVGASAAVTLQPFTAAGTINVTGGDQGGWRGPGWKHWSWLLEPITVKGKRRRRPATEDEQEEVVEEVARAVTAAIDDHLDDELDQIEQAAEQAVREVRQQIASARAAMFREYVRQEVTRRRQERDRIAAEVTLARRRARRAKAIQALLEVID